MPENLHDPAEILSDLWRRLAAGRDRHDHPFHTAAFATRDGDDAVSIRTVALRLLEPESAMLAFHTDRRSPKYAALSAHPRCAWCFYDPTDQLQLRLTTTAALHTDDAIADDLWTRTPPPVRAMYASPDAPGTPLPELAADTNPPAGDGRRHFAAVSCRIDSIDWLLLGQPAHRRIVFHFEHGTCTFMAIAP